MSVVGAALGWSLGATLGPPSGAGSTADPFWESVALRCPAARILLGDDYATERALIEGILDKWIPVGSGDAARVYLARHIAEVTRFGAGGRTGALASESLGPSSVSYAAGGGASAMSDFGSTQWGQLYRMLVCVPGPEVIP